MPRILPAGRSGGGGEKKEEALKVRPRVRMHFPSERGIFFARSRREGLASAARVEGAAPDLWMPGRNLVFRLIPKPKGPFSPFPDSDRRGLGKRLGVGET